MGDAEVVPFAAPPRRAGRWHRVDPSRFAASQRVAFTGRNLHVGTSKIVHATSWLDWIDDLVLPAPACRQGFAGHGAHNELRPTRWPVTCRRCRRLRGDEVVEDDGSVQGVLFGPDRL